MTAVKLNTYPYFNDYDESKGFHQIAFVPGRPIQARELTQIQSILQTQIKRMGQHFFKNGTVILPGHTYYDNRVYAVRLNATNAIGVEADSIIPTLIGKTVSNTTGTKAFVKHAEVSTSTDPAILYVTFIDGGSTGVLEFSSGEVISDVDNVGNYVDVSTTYTPVSKAAIVSINEGVYYANGYFVQVLAQTVALSSTTNLPSAFVGLSVDESIVTETDDDSLFDNSIGSSNYSAPGSHRVKIALSLSVQPYSTDTTFANENLDRVDFIALYNILNGEIQYEKSQDTEYNKFESLLAKRTYEESGNYIVDKFEMDVYDYRDNDRGAWTTQTAYLEGDVVSVGTQDYFAVTSGISGVSEPSHTVGTATDGGIDFTAISKATSYLNYGKLKTDYRLGIADPLTLEQKADDSFVIDVKNGIAYIKGYRTEIRGASSKVVAKSRTFKEEFNNQIIAPNPISVYASSKVNNSVVTPVLGLPDIRSLDKFSVYDNINGTGTVIGTCRVKSIDAITGGVFSDEAYKVAIFDVKMVSGKEFGANAVSIKSTQSTINLSRRNVQLSGTHTASGSSIFGVLSNYDEELRVGSYVSFGNRDGTFYKVTAIVSDVEITVTTIAGGAAGLSQTTPVALHTSVIGFKAGAKSFITPLPRSYVKTMRSVDANGDINTTYKTTKQVTRSTNGAGEITYVCPPGEKLRDTDHRLSVSGSAGTILNIQSAWISTDGSTLTIPTSAGLSPSTSYNIHLKVSKSGVAAAERLKVMKPKTVYVFDDGVYLSNNKTNKITWLDVNDSTNGFKNTTGINLGYADVVRINSIKSSSSTSAWQNTPLAPAIDVAKSYFFDNGQRPEFYDFATIKSATASTAPLEVSFDYYEHTSGDYFTVDSYQNTPYAMIPTTTVNGMSYNLRDCIDFRCRVNDINSSTDFLNVGDAMETNEAFNFDYSYYLARKDLLLLAENGELRYIFGTPAIKPAYPVNTTDSMLIAKVDILPYTANAELDVKITMVGTSGYKMSDIERLDNRVTNVETYVSLSLLEKQTADFRITDKYGLDRVKNGFYVANFSTATNHTVFGGVNLPDYRCTIIPEYKLCAANRFGTDYPLVMAGILDKGTSAPSVGSVPNISVYPSHISTLQPSSTVTLNTNGTIIANGAVPLFSTKLNVNPFNVFAYSGKVNMYPSYDFWQTTSYSYNGTMYMNENGSLTSSFEAAKANLINAWSDRTVSTAELSSYLSTNNQVFDFTGIENITNRGGNFDTVERHIQAENDVGFNPNSGVNFWTLQAFWANDWNQQPWQIRTGDWKASIQGDTINPNATPVEVRENVGAMGVSKYLRKRMVAVVARDLIPNTSHTIFFDNTAGAEGIINFSAERFDFDGTLSASSESLLKFYGEYSLINNNDAALDTAKRSFSEVTGNDYDTAANGKLVKIANAYWGVMAGWEKTATGYAIYVFPTQGFSDIRNIAMNASVQFEVYGENQFGIYQEMGFTAVKKSYIYTPGFHAGLSTPLGNLFALTLIKGDYFTTGEKKFFITRDERLSTPTVSPGNSYEIIDPSSSHTFESATASSNFISGADSKAECTYTGVGTTQDIQRTEVFTLSGQLSVTTERTVWVDPLAQSFMIKKSSNAIDSDIVMVSGVKIWFASKPNITSNDLEQKCSIDIINSFNGMPTNQLVYPWATVTYRSKDITLATLDNSWTPMVCTFESPVPLRTDFEYCIRVVAPTSNGFEVWTSKMGEECVNKPGSVITAQQSDGSLFTSQNASTWTPDQYSDMALQLIVNQYPINQSSATRLQTSFGSEGFSGYTGSKSNVTYVTSGTASEFSVLPVQPFGSNGTNIVKVYHPRHPFFKTTKGKSFVKLKTTKVGDVVTEAVKALINGKYFKVFNVKPNSYSLDLSQQYSLNAAKTEFTLDDITTELGTILTSVNARWGSNVWEIEAAGKYDMFRMNANFIMIPEQTTVNFTKKMAYVDDNGVHMESSYEAFPVGIDYQNDKQFVSFLKGELQTNAYGVDRDFNVSTDESVHGLNFRMHLSTSNKWVTPILEMQTLSMSIGRSLQMPHDISDAEVGTTDFVKVIDNQSCVYTWDATRALTSVQLPSSPNWITNFAVGGVLNIAIPTSTHTITVATSTAVDPFTATFTVAGHGFNVGDLVSISGVTGSLISNGYVRPVGGSVDGAPFTIIAKDTNTFTVTVSGNIGTASLSSANCVRTSVNNGVYEIVDIDFDNRKVMYAGTNAPEAKLSTLYFSTEFTAESNSSGGTSQSKFITKEVTLANPATSLHFTTDMATPVGAVVELWYRTGNEILTSTDWTKVEIDTIPSNNSISLYENSVEVNNIAEFTKFQAKFVFTSTTHFNSAIGNLRIIAIA